jgi:hypothetical protein
MVPSGGARPSQTISSLGKKGLENGFSAGYLINQKGNQSAAGRLGWQSAKRGHTQARIFLIYIVKMVITHFALWVL